jgi:phosphoglycolate phosphatase
VDAFVFDLDGTLIDSKDDIAASANHARLAVGLAPRPFGEIHAFIGEGAQRLIERSLGPEHADRVPEALAAWRAHYEAHMLDRTRVFPGVAEAVVALGGPRAVLTNKPADSARALVEALGLGGIAVSSLVGGQARGRDTARDTYRVARRRSASS